MTAPVDVLAVRDCRACGGGRCDTCRGTGVEQVACFLPPSDFSVRADADGFEQDRELCPCYEGVKINEGVDQCMHPRNRVADNWCEPKSCPLLARVGGAA